MTELDRIISEISKKKEYIRKQYKIKQIGVFGSYVRNEQTEDSDVDILIDYDARFGISLFELIRLEDYLSDILERKVDLAMKKTLKPVIGKRILQEVKYI
jgi:predicted nucleotidyltransferase